MAFLDPAKQLEFLKEGVEEMISPDALLEKLKEKRPLIVKTGFDPTAPDIHLGHTVLLRKLKTFQALGHRVVILIGDFTARIGDPSGKSVTRKPLLPTEIEENARTYCDQVFRILDKDKTRLAYNHRWFAGMALSDVLKLAGKYTVARIIERDDFSQRLKNHEPISMVELLYPLMQGYDSVELKADVELGGRDQKFNLLVGRELMREYGQHPQVLMTMPILEGLDGKKKMSKSLGNYVGIQENARDMFGKLMSIPDEQILKYFSLLTDVAKKDIKAYERKMTSGENPRDFKILLAKEIVTMYRSKEEAERAEIEFKEVFSQGGRPKDIPEICLSQSPSWIVDIVMASGHCRSNGEARRLIKQGAVKLEEEKITDEKAHLNIKSGDLLKLGKRGFYRIKLN